MNEDLDKHINPSHYKSHPSGVECITVTRHFNFNIGNAIKYLWRQGLKDSNPSIQDLEKAKWYLTDEIARLTLEEDRKSSIVTVRDCCVNEGVPHEDIYSMSSVGDLADYIDNYDLPISFTQGITPVAVRELIMQYYKTGKPQTNETD